MLVSVDRLLSEDGGLGLICGLKKRVRRVAERRATDAPLRIPDDKASQ